MFETKRGYIPLKNIRINDDFWSRYIRLVRESTIPYQWATLNDKVEGAEPSHCIENFRIAAGESDGAIKGIVFRDSDLAKWLEAVAYTLEIYPDPKLELLADETIELIGHAQQPDGYLNTYFTFAAPEKRWTNLREGHELYTAGHFIEAAVAYHRATGKHHLLDIMCRFADLACRLFLGDDPRLDGCPGHPEIELALVKLYRETGAERYLDLARYFIERRGEAPDCFLEERKRDGWRFIFPELGEYDPVYVLNHKPVRRQEEADGHAVRAVYLYCAMADIAEETADEALLLACRRLWDNIIQKRMYINGGIGSSGYMERFTTDYDLPLDRGYCETCASVGLALFGMRMARITGEAHYMDGVERALYNTVTAGIALDGKSFFYVNPLEVWPPACMENTSLAHIKPVRQKWFDVPCCPTNVARTLASLGQYIYFVRGDRLHMNLFIANDADIPMEKGSVHICTSTRFPWENQVELSIESPAPFTLAVRMPDYVREFSITINRQPAAAELQNGYVLLPLDAGKSFIAVTLDLSAHLVYAHEQVRSSAGQAAVMRGPLLYCLEEMDNAGPLSALQIDSDATFSESWTEELGGAVLLQASGWRAKSPKSDMLYKNEAPTLEKESLRFLPYCFWSNRTPGEMRTFIRVSPKK
ncbi:MAG: beta-L-arabinofuranosidase domain-containing protein [Christensenellales bacterium]